MVNRVDLGNGDDPYTLILGVTVDENGENVTGVDAEGGDDVLTLKASKFSGQIHAWGSEGDDTLNLTWRHYITPHDGETHAPGHHVRGDKDGLLDQGSDTFNFQNVDMVKNVIVGRIDDYDHSRDILQIEGETIENARMESHGFGWTEGYYWKIVEFSGDQLSEPQQWIAIDTKGGWIFYALEGARVVAAGTDGANDGNQEAHFIEELPEGGIEALSPVKYTDPINVIPDSANDLIDTVQNAGGLALNDDDNDLSEANTVIQGTNVADLIAAGLNNDTVNALAGNDTVWGGSGNDTVSAGSGFDEVYGGTGQDELYGNSGNDLLDGGHGDDDLNGGIGIDSLFGGEGQDTLTGMDGYDVLYGGDGNDVLNGNAGFDFLEGDAGDDVLNGGNSPDELYGGDGNDTLNGNPGADTVYGGAGDDEVNGNAGSDTLSGGLGDDIVRGGIGTDTFIFTSGHDTIRDFQNNIDTLALMSGEFGITDFSDLKDFGEISNGNAVFTFDANNSITINGISNLNAFSDDFELL